MRENHHFVVQTTPSYGGWNDIACPATIVGIIMAALIIISSYLF